MGCLPEKAEEVTDNSVLGGVLDTSALLALVYDEPGADRVEPALRHGALTSTVNWAETLSRMAELGEPVETSVPRITRTIALMGTLRVLPYDETHALETARLRVRTPSHPPGSVRAV